MTFCSIDLESCLELNVKLCIDLRSVDVICVYASFTLELRVMQFFGINLILLGGSGLCHSLRCGNCVFVTHWSGQSA